MLKTKLNNNHFQWKVKPLKGQLKEEVNALLHDTLAFLNKQFQLIDFQQAEEEKRAMERFDQKLGNIYPDL